MENHREEVRELRPEIANTGAGACKIRDIRLTERSNGSRVARALGVSSDIVGAHSCTDAGDDDRGGRAERHGEAEGDEGS